MTFVGLDLHKRYITACALDLDGAVVAEAKRFPVTLDALLAFLAPLPGPITVAMEATPPPLRATPPGRRPPNPRGEFGIMLEWSWRVERARSIEAGSWSTERRIDTAVARLRGPRVTAVSVTGRLPELVVGLSDGKWVHSFMTAEGQPAWTLFLPDGSWLTVERGRIIHDVQNQRPGGTHRVESA